MAFIRNTDKFIEGSKLFFSIERAKAAVQSDLDLLASEDSGIKLRLDTIEGSGEGSIAKAKLDAQAYADQKVAALVNSAPSVLDTLKELADAIGGDQNFAATVAGQIGEVANSVASLQITVDSNFGTLDSMLGAEQARATAAEAVLAGRLDVVQGGPLVEGSIQKALVDAKDYTDTMYTELSNSILVLENDPVTKTYVDTEVQSAKDWASLLRDETENYINSEVQNLVTTISENKAEFDFAYDELVSISNGIHHQLLAEITSRQNGDNALDARLDIIEGADTVSGSVAKALKDAKAYADSADALLNGRIDQEVSDRQSETATLGEEVAALWEQSNSANARIIALEADPVTKTYVDGQVSGIQSQVDTEKGRVDAILSASEADKDSFAEIVQLINSVDTSNDQAFASYVLSNDAALAQEISDRQSEDQRIFDYADLLSTNLDIRMVQEVSDRQAGDSALSLRVDALEADPVTKTYVDGEVSNLQGQLAQEVSDRQSAVSTIETLLLQVGSDIAYSKLFENVETISSNMEIDPNSGTQIFFCDVSSGAITLTLPDPSSFAPGRKYVVKDMGSSSPSGNFITVAAQAGQTVDGQSSFEMRMPFEAAQFVSDGAQWFVM